MSKSIKDLRLKAGFSQVELAAKLGISHRHILNMKMMRNTLVV